MGMWSIVSIHVEAEKKEQIDLIRTLDTQDNGWGKAIGLNPNVLEWKESLKFFDAENVIKQIADILSNQGKAYIIVNCEEDIPECITYYYLGDGVKQIHFTSEDTPKQAKKKSSFTIKHYTESDFLRPLSNLSGMELLRAYCVHYSTIDFQKTENQLCKEMVHYYRSRLGESDFRLECFWEGLDPFEIIILSPLLNKGKNVEASLEDVG